MELGDYLESFTQRGIQFPSALLHQVELLFNCYYYRKNYRAYLIGTKLCPLNVQAQAAKYLILQIWFPSEIIDMPHDFEFNFTLMDMKDICGDYVKSVLEKSNEAAAAVAALTAVPVSFELYRDLFESQNSISIRPGISTFTERESCLKFLSQCTEHLDAVGDEVIRARFMVIYYFDTYLRKANEKEEEDRKAREIMLASQEALEIIVPSQEAREIGGKNALLAFLDVFGMDIRTEKFKNFLVQEHSINIDEEEEKINWAKDIIYRNVGSDAITPLTFINCYMDVALSVLEEEERKKIDVVKLESTVKDLLGFFQNGPNPNFCHSTIANHFPSNLAAVAVILSSEVLIPHKFELAFLNIMKFTELAGMKGLTKKNVLTAMFEVKTQCHKFMGNLPWLLGME